MLDRIIEIGLRNRLLVLILGVLIMAAGWYAYEQLPVDAFPDVSPNLVQVFTVTEGLAPEEIETFVTYPVEAALTGLPGVVRVRSVSNFGLSVVNIYFEDRMDIYFARQLVGERLQEARERIPAGFGSPEMGPISTGMGQVLFYYIEDATGEFDLTELRSIQDWLVKFHLQTVPGVTEVLGIGGYEKQFQVDVLPEQLLRYDVTLGEILERIEANNLNVGAQFIEKNSEEFVVRSIGLTRNVSDLERIVVKTVNGRPVFLADLAEIRTGGAVRRGVQTRNGVGEVVAGQVIKLVGTNSSQVIADVEAKVAEINRILPAGVQLVPYYEQKSLVTAAVRTVTGALLQGVALVALVLLAFMGGLRPSLVVALSLPFSLLFAVLFMERLGLTANLMSLGGLAIAIGMMVDGTIVMVENTDRHLRRAGTDADRRTTVGRACREVARPVAFSIVIVVLVFVPLLTLHGVEGKTFRPLALTVALGMLGSLIFALVQAPALSSWLLRRAGSETREPWLVRTLNRGYRPLVETFVRRPWITALLIVALLVGGFVIAPRIGSEFTPRLREGTVVVRLTMAPSISLTESTAVTGRVERRLLAIPEVAEVVSRIGRGEVGAHTDPVNSAEMFVLLAPREEWRSAASQEDIERVIRRELGNVPGVLVNLTQPIEMTVDELLEGVRAELAVKVFGDDIDVLGDLAGRVAEAVRTVDGAADVQVDQVSGAPQLLIRLDREALARYGLNVADVQQTLATAVGGTSVGNIFEGVRRFDIQVRYPQEDRSDADRIADLLVATPGGGRVPLNEVAHLEEIVGPRQITREDNQRFVSVQCNVVGRDIGSFVKDARTVIAEQVEFPAGYLTTWGGQYRLQQEANRRLMVVIPIVLIVHFLLLFTSFNSLRNSLLIMVMLPLALVGGLVALWMAGLNMSVPASIGFIALFGITLGNGMVLVTRMNQLTTDGMSHVEAAVSAATQRLRPVLMTAATTALGLIPLLLARGVGSEVQRPLATVVVGGLISATLLTLLILPALYPLFHRSRGT